MQMSVHDQHMDDGFIEAPYANICRCKYCQRFKISFLDEYQDVIATSHLSDEQARELAFYILGVRLQ
jgi:hypothetical protein